MKTVRDISILKFFRNKIIRKKAYIFALKIQGIIVQDSNFSSMVHK